MKKLLLIIIIVSIKAFSQDKGAIDLSKFKLCQLTIDDLKKQDSDLKKVTLEEMNLCADGFVEDSRFQNRIGYESKLYPGVIFQKYVSNDIIIAKIHLTREFKGYLPDGKFIDLKSLKASEIVKEYDSLSLWNSRDCSDYLTIKRGEELYFYVKIDKNLKPQYPIDQKYYSDQSIQGIDIIIDCHSFFENNKDHPLYIVDGKEVSQQFIRDLKPEDIDTIVVYKDKSAIDKYGEKGKKGVIDIKLKKK